jgi:hypothetical protein
VSLIRIILSVALVICAFEVVLRQSPRWLAAFLLCLILLLLTFGV